MKTISAALALFLLSVAAVPQPVSLGANEEGPPTLIVQVVDPVWIPLPEADVTVKASSGKGESKSAHTDANGYAKFWVDSGTDYTIEAKTINFNKKILKHVFIAKAKPSAPTAHVQIKLQPSGPFTYNK